MPSWRVEYHRWPWPTVHLHYNWCKEGLQTLSQDWIRNSVGPKIRSTTAHLCSTTNSTGSYLLYHIGRALPWGHCHSVRVPLANLSVPVGKRHVCGVSRPGVELKFETRVLGGDGSVCSSMAIATAPSPTRWVSRCIPDSDELSGNRRIWGPRKLFLLDLRRVIYFPPDGLFRNSPRSVSIP